jgi:predicted RNase H-like HicB family nuclease
MSRIYRVRATREDGAWLAEVADLAGAHTTARSLAALDRAIREVIALVEDLPRGAAVEAGLALDYDYDLGDRRLAESAARLRADRERIRDEERVLTEQTARLARRLVADAGLSARDAATILSVSPQRISQVAPRRGRGGPAAGDPAPGLVRDAAGVASERPELAG